MTTLDEVTATALAYGDTRVAAVQAMVGDLQAQIAQDQKDKAALQAAFDAFKAADLTEDAAYLDQIAKLEAQVAANMPIQYVEFSDFAQQNSGLFMAGNSIVGNGVGKTVYRMKAGTSTKKAVVDALDVAAHEVNQFRLIRSGRFGSGADPSGINHHDFTLQFTDQAHAYGGLNIGYANGPRVTDAKIQGMPGFASSPPGETFSCSLWHSYGSVLTRVTCDGRNPTTGAPQAASLFATNNVTGTTTFNDCIAMFAAYGFGVAMWQSAGNITFNRCVFANNRKQINIEQSWGGVYNFNGCSFKAGGAPYVAQVSNAIAYPSSKITFTDCTTDAADGVLRVLVYGKTAKNNQEATDVKCFIGGKDVTADPTKFLIVRS